MRPHQICLLLLTLYLLLPLQSLVLACSGGRPTPLSDVIDAAEIIVEVAALQTDEVHMNAVVRVRRYLAGGPGPQYLFIQQRDPATLRQMLEGMASGSCAMMGFALPLDQAMVLFLKRSPDGTYHSSLEPIQFNLASLAYQFSPQQPTSFVYERNSDDSIDRREVNEQQFIDLVAQLSGDSPSAPLPDSPYPLPAPLLLTTSSAERYLLPVDGAAPYQVPVDQILRRSHYRWLGQFVEGLTGCTTDCETFTADGTTPVSLSGTQIHWGPVTGLLARDVAGDAFFTSPTNDLIAVWQGSNLNLYRLNNPRVGINYLTEEPDFGFYKRVILQQPIIYRAAWSRDGRTLAYSDGRGLWLWDVFALQAGPRLFLPIPPSGTIPYARYWSPSGRYLALAEGPVLRNYDTVLASRLPDGIISTDDRILLAFHTDAAGISNFSVCRLAPEVPCHHYDYGINQTGPDPLWISPTQYLIPARLDAERVIYWESSYRGAFGTTVPGSAFDYEAVSGTLVTLDDDNTLHVVVREDNRWQQIDLSAEIDQEIVALEWLPSPFLILND